MFKIPKAEKRIAENRINDKRQTAVVENGVSITPMPVTMKETVTITYDGLLAQSGAALIYAHVGNGNNSYWDNVQDIPMKMENKVWSANLKPADSRLNFCFHDGANNWDNNNGYNWSLTIHNGQQV